MMKIRQANKRIVCILILVLASAVTANVFAQNEKPKGTIKSSKGDTDFARANPEDITNENFPQLIESFDYPNADISEIVKAISKLTGKNFILEKGVSGKISIIAPSQITVAEAYKAFLTALAMNGFTIVPSGNFLKIRSIQNAAKESIDTYSGNYFPNSDQLITRIMKLKYINAEEVQKTLRPIVNQSGDMVAYSPTNSLIITDLGSNVERITNIINQIDVPGFEEKLVVMPIRYARAKDIAELIDQIINKGDKNTKFNAGIPRFRSGQTTTSSSGSGAANYSLVIPDTRTNSIIVVGNDAGIDRIRGLLKKLDFRIRPEDGGGVYVYYVRHGESEKIANVLNGIASESEKVKSQPAGPTGGGGTGSAPAAPSQAVFGGDVKVSADKDNNSLIITASKQDYEVVRTILAKIDIPRDQVFVKAIILEMNADATNNWGINYYRFAKGSNGAASTGAGRIGFASEKLDSLLTPAKDSGLTFGFGNNDMMELKVGGATFEIPSLIGLIRFLKKNAGGNVLSTPQITALDNEEALIEVGENVPVSSTSNVSSTGAVSPSIERKDLTLKLKITPFISPDTDSVRMKIDQKIESLNKTAIGAKNLAESAVAYSTRTIQTNIVVNSNDTAVLGGLMEDKEIEEVVKVPVLGDIPIIGWLFKSKSTEKSKKNLLVFITPKILRNSQDNADLLNTKLNERVDFIQQNLKGRDPHGLEIDKLPRRALVEEETKEFIEEPSAIPAESNEMTPDLLPQDETGALPGDLEEGE
ncbi:MAG: type II secretion system secretin GspD [Bdellovibrionales bacterium]|nr:type II secretion system secretin GspD [Bdellovibrionales bacterium]